MSRELLESLYDDLSNGVAKDLKSTFGLKLKGKLHEITLRPMDDSDYEAFAGAGDNALIGEIEVTDWPNTESDDEEFVVILDDEGAQIQDSEGYYAYKPTKSREIARAVISKMKSPITTEELKQFGFTFPSLESRANKKLSSIKIAKESFDELVAAIQDAKLSNKARIRRLHETVRKAIKEGRLPDMSKNPADPENIKAMLEASEEPSFMDNVIRDIKAAKAYYEEGKNKVAYELLVSIMTQVATIQQNLGGNAPVDTTSAPVEVDAEVSIDKDVDIDTVDEPADAPVDTEVEKEEELPIADSKDPMLEESKKKLKENDATLAKKVAGENPDDHEDGAQDKPKEKKDGSAGIKDLPVGAQPESQPKTGNSGSGEAQDDPKKKDGATMGAGSESKVKEDMAGAPSSADTVQYQIIASGISMKDVAEKLASQYKGQVKPDDKDAQKFMVVSVKQA